MNFSSESARPGGSAKTTAHMARARDGTVVPVPRYVQRPVPAFEQLWEVVVWIDMWSTVAWTPDRGSAARVAESYVPRWPLAQIWHQHTLYDEYTVSDGAVTVMQTDWEGKGWRQGQTVNQAIYGRE